MGNLVETSIEWLLQLMFIMFLSYIVIKNGVESAIEEIYNKHSKDEIEYRENINKILELLNDTKDKILTLNDYSGNFIQNSDIYNSLKKDIFGTLEEFLAFLIEKNEENKNDVIKLLRKIDKSIETEK